MEDLEKAINKALYDVAKIRKVAESEFHKKIKELQKVIRANTKIHKDIDFCLEDNGGKVLLFALVYEHNGYDLIGYYCGITKETDYNVEIFAKAIDGDFRDIENSSLSEVMVFAELQDLKTILGKFNCEIEHKGQEKFSCI